MTHPLTSSQLAIYYESVNMPGVPVYVIPVLLTLDPGVDLDLLRSAVDKVIANYPILSMVLGKDNEGMPFLTSAGDDSSLCCSLEHLGSGELDDLLVSLPEPFDLDGGPLFGARIFSTLDGNYLYLAFHHIVADGSTYGLVLKAIVAAYNNQPVPVEAISIFDVQAREETLALSPRHDEAKEWYADTLAGLESGSLPFPDRLEVTDSKPADPLASVGKIDRILNVDYDKVFAFSRKHHLPLSIVFDSAFGYLLGIWNASDQSCFSTIFAGRKSDADKTVAGMMVKTLPVFCSWNADTGVIDYIRTIADQHKRAKDYSDCYSFAEICADTGFSPDINFSYRGSIQAENTVIDGFCTESRRLGCSSTGSGMLFMVDHMADHLVVRSEFQGGSYSRQFVECMLDAYDMVIQGFLEKDKLSEIDFCSPAMIQRLESFNATVDSVALADTVVDVFRRHVADMPDKAAAVLADGQVSYKETAELADKVASFVCSMGLGSGDAVAVMVDRNRWMLPASLGVLFSGAAYLPLDPSYPVQRLNFMMRDAGVRLLVMDRNLDLQLEDDLENDIRILYTDEVSDLTISDGNICKPSPDDTFIILYTSGTTGNPKGVRLSHSNLMALAESHNRRIPESATPDCIWSMYASYGFDAGFFCLLLPVIYGGTTAIVPEDIRLDMDALNRFFIDNNVNFGFMTTQVGRIFAASVEKTSLRALAVGGEKLVPCVPPADFSFYNLYGPTEGTVYSHALLVDKLYSRVPIGRALDDYKNYIVDKYGRRMPLGALGELLIAGPQVSEGYLNLPQKTAAVFCSNPFSTDPLFADCYHTGDIVRLLPVNGEADIVGRNDGQVKIRGFRIELTEVEQIVREFPAVKDATVQAFDSPAGGKFIAAYVVADEKINVGELNDFIADHKPPYMVPEVTLQIDRIPLNRNQKVDKRALPVPELSDAPAEEANRNPNLLESLICSVVSEVLKQESVPLSVPLSRLGLTSISSIRLASALYKRFGINFKGADLVKHATVLSIEDDVLRQLLDEGMKSEPVVEGGSGWNVAPLTVSQQGVYADTMRRPDSTAYNIPVYFRFDPATDPDALASALRTIIDAHPYLRDARLQMGDLDVEQSVLPHVPARVEVKSMSDLEFDDYKNCFIRPFDLMSAPLYRFEVVATPLNVYLLMDVHHIVFDGSSLTVLLSQLKTILEGGGVSPETASYLDYAETECKWLNGVGGAESADFFKSMLADCEAASDIPSNRPISDDAGDRGIVAEPVDFSMVSDFCSEKGLTPAALFLAATCYATARFSCSRSAFISTISSGRADVRFSDTFGMFVKTLPISMTIGDESALQFAFMAKQRLADVIENEMYPYSRICADFNYSPNIVYEYQYGLVDDLVIDGRKVEQRLFDVDTLKFKIAVRIEEVDGKPSVAVHYRKGIYTDDFMRTFCGSIARVARSIMECPDAEVRKLSMLSQSQSLELQKFSSSALVEHSDKCFHHLMEHQAVLHPDRVAVIAGDRTLSYAELDRNANIVANNLIARGVKRGDKVVILLSRTSRFFSSLYGVLKAGAAYIPSSPDYPEDRKSSIIEDSKAAFVITDDNVESLHVGASDANPDVEVSPDDLVYLIYTSGSTGKPKGVLLRHRGIVNYVSPHPAVFHTHSIVQRCSVVGSITTVAFDMALKEWGIALSNGLSLVFADDVQCNDPVALADLFGRYHVDYFNTTPSRMQQYMELDEFCNMLAGCKVVICGAEKYPENLLQNIRTVAPDAEIFNTYGPTEITVSCNAACLTGKSVVSVGRPLCNYIEHIVDLDDNLLPPGVVGELLIGGDNIALGYNANPSQTEKAFVIFNGVSTYRSGDYARWDEDGNVVILGRKDTQVKLRGLRIELGEIERVLGAIDAVGSSHVMIRNVAGRENLVAYYVLRPSASCSSQQIKERMAEKLTDYMVPSFFVELKQMPLTPNGKINARELPEPAIAQREAGKLAADDRQQFFIDVFKDVLATDTVYADDNFFSLGGTSLTATRIMIAASKAGYRIVYADIFDNPTPEGLAALVGAEAGSGSSVAVPVAGDVRVVAEVGSDGYDYSAINAVLAGNTLCAFRQGAKRNLSSVLLTGATGYAGMHVLHELLSASDARVICLVRDGKSGISAADRIHQLYFYYFGHPVSDSQQARLKIVRGDITGIDVDFDPGEPIDTVINCAANVKHFSAGTDIEDINYYGVLGLIDWCAAHGAALVQTSTVSVTGSQRLDRNEVLTEQSLYIGQNLMGNKYVESKFWAERAVLQAHADGKIVGKIVRLGNLAPREQDGEFQVNFTTNGFMNRLKSVNLVGCYPYAMFSQNKDISPIDDVAKAIVLFAQTPDACVVFHGNNANRYSLGNFYYEANKAGLDIHPVEDDEFLAALDEAKKDPEKLNALVGLMAYEGVGTGLKPVDYSNSYSNQVLLRMGFHWPVISSEYVFNLVLRLEGLGFFSVL